MTITPLPSPTAAASAAGHRAVARVATASGSRYLQQLAKHFAHKLPTACDPASGWIDFPIGRVDLTADVTGLTLSLGSATAADLATLEDVVARHLVRFAFRETLEIAWVRSQPNPETATI